MITKMTMTTDKDYDKNDNDDGRVWWQMNISTIDEYYYDDNDDVGDGDDNNADKSNNEINSDDKRLQTMVPVCKIWLVELLILTIASRKHGIGIEI